MRGCSFTSAANSESHVPCFQERVDTGTYVLSGCRGVSGLVPQPLCMKFKSAEADWNTFCSTTHLSAEQTDPFRNLWTKSFPQAFNPSRPSEGKRTTSQGTAGGPLHEVPSPHHESSHRRLLSRQHLPLLGRLALEAGLLGIRERVLRLERGRRSTGCRLRSTLYMRRLLPQRLQLLSLTAQPANLHSTRLR
jgi:hypothetical protein